MNKALPIAIFLIFPFISKAQGFSAAPYDATSHEIASGPFNQFPVVEKIEKDTTISLTNKKHSAKKATILSAILPGAGQFYNEKYWKIPLIYTGLVGTAWFTYYSKVEMLERQDALTVMLDGDPNTNPDPEYAGISQEQLTADRNYYRANSDYGIIAFAAVYLINIIDATVDGHFYNFNIDKPLAMQKTRHWHFSSYEVQKRPTIGVAYRF